MPCPLRVVLFFFSLALIACALLYQLSGEEANFLRKRSDRTWLGFVLALFTGELLYDARYGEGAWRHLGCVGAQPLPAAPQEALPAQEQPAAGAPAALGKE